MTVEEEDDDFSEVKFEDLQGTLGGLLGKLLEHLNKSLKDLISKEVAANIDFADFKIAIERENEKLESKISYLNSDIKGYEKLIAQYNEQGECGAVEEVSNDTSTGRSIGGGGRGGRGM